MPKNQVSDLITDQEMVFARLVLSGTMTDRDAAQAAGLNPDTAAYTKSKPRVRAYMIEHRAATQRQVVEQESERQRRREERREQVLDRLWELASLSSEKTRGSITSQVKALSMIVAIEGLIPDRRSIPCATQPAAPPVEPDIYPAAPKVPEPEPAPNPAPKPGDDMSFPNFDRSEPSVFNPFINPQKRAPVATGYVFDAVLDKPTPLSLSFSTGAPPLKSAKTAEFYRIL